MSRRLARAVTVSAIGAAIVGGSALPALAAPGHDQQIENTITGLLKDAQKAPGGLTLQGLTSTINQHVGKNAWERLVDFQVVPAYGYSQAFGSFSLASTPDGSIGLASRSADGGCTLATFSGGKIQVRSIADVGKNCTGTMALRDPRLPISFLDPVIPAAVSGLAATPGEGSVTLAWVAPADLDLKEYKVLVNGQASTTVAAPASTFTVTGLTGGVEYTFSLVSVDQAGNESRNNGTVQATPLNSDVNAPAPPVAAPFAQGGYHKVDLAWEPSPDSDVTKYRIYRQLLTDDQLVAVFVYGEALPTTGTLVTTLDKDARTYSDTGLENQKFYAYQITAVDGAGNESAAALVLGIVPDMDPPPVPTNLVATAGNDGARLTWTNPTDLSDVSTASIYQDGVKVGTIQKFATGMAQSFVVAGLTDGRPYTFEITTVDGSGNESVRSNAITVTPQESVAPAAPTNLTAGLANAYSWDPNSAKVLTANWAAPTVSAGTVIQKYKVYVDKFYPSAGIYAPESTRTTIDDATSYLDQSNWLRLEAGSTYRVTVTALDTAGQESPRSAPIIVNP